MSFGKVYAVGIGPGAKDLVTPRMRAIIAEVDVVAGYTKYLEQIVDITDGKEIISSGMTGEIERCKRAMDTALTGKCVALISSGDPGIYAMAGLLYELAEDNKYSMLEIDVVPGITAAAAAAGVLGAPLMNDFATISLSDLLTPQELILKRVRAVASADMVCVLYNPRSKKRVKLLDDVIDIFLKNNSELMYGMVKHASRDKEEIYLGRLDKLDVTLADMSTVVIIGSSNTVLKNNKLYTLRGYKNKYNL